MLNYAMVRETVSHGDVAQAVTLAEGDGDLSRTGRGERTRPSKGGPC